MARKVKVIEDNSIKKKINRIDSRITISLLIVCLIIFVLSIFGIVTYYSDSIKELEEENNNIALELADIKYEKQKLEDEILQKDSDLKKITGNKTIYYVSQKLDFYDDNIVFQIEGYGNKYYTYDCMMEKVANKDSYSYWAYNKEAAKSYGLKKGGC